MSRFTRKNDSLSVKHLNPINLQFSMFTKEEIKKLCVMKIHTPLTLDQLGHPLPGGLYDKNLGPLTERSEPCGTCKKNYINCPGHLGYIELPLPVVNPIFHPIIGTILRCTCLSCYHIQIPSWAKYLFCIQIGLLNCGLTTESLDVSRRMSELLSVYHDLEQIPKDEIQAIVNYEILAEEKSNELNGRFILNKNTEDLRNQVLQELLQQTRKLRAACMYCKKTLDKVKVLRNKIILTKKCEPAEGDRASKVMPSKMRTFSSQFINPEQSKRYMQQIWAVETDLLKHIISVLTNIEIDNPTDVFYCDIIPVIPPNCRPANVVNKRIAEHPQVQAYKNILQQTILLKLIIQVVNNKGSLERLPMEAKSAYNVAYGSTPVEKLNNAWEYLQTTIDDLIDRLRSSNTRNNNDGYGLKQIIEKKSGIMRMHMMGKRVNYSARSVITPDPNLDIDEIGIPEQFAKNLTYPVPVTMWNVQELRKMIMNGPNVHPGAVMVEYEDGTIKRINTNNQTQQESILKRLLTPDDKENGFKGVKRVHRHLINGDVLLLNRQPTLHKPSIMAHKARILKNEKTLRLHYANCKAYNADFDGDEMNAHYPQNELARSEAYNIVNVSNQYLVPKDGTPLSGLIQDHMISGVRLTMRGRFFNKLDYQHLVYQALSYKIGKIQLLPPSILKPQMLWSGKQILSTVIINIIPDGKKLINLQSTAKISPKAWESETPRAWRAGGTQFKDQMTMSEGEVIIRNGELLCGVLDKTHYGATPYGLVHCIYELYGGGCATKFLSALTKLFMRFLQQEGFTLGVHDILVIDEADKKRQKIIKKSRKIGIEAITTALNLPVDTPVDEIIEKIQEQQTINPKLRTIIDRQYKTMLDSYTNKINKTCLPAGLLCKFPQNNLQLMVQSGAKGSTVNTMQISCLLGQIELEGKRPPVMISGKSLPSFPLFEFQPRAGGFIDGRFMTGIQPQEFFFHCMAGREGLIDTAVKTSRSGYLQRCLIKHLEGLSVGYDMTVRDSDGSVIQFLYGEDGMDISKVQFLNEKQMEFLAENSKALIDKEILNTLKNNKEDEQKMKEHQEQISNWRKIFGDPLRKQHKSPFTLFSEMVKRKSQNRKLTKDQIIKIWQNADDDLKAEFRKKCDSCPLPLNSVYQSDHYFGSLNERVNHLLENYLDRKQIVDKKQRKQIENMLKMKTIESLCNPGESVGLLAAQSIGEPSTQMTLNTFHFAGRGEMNVTLGIPRLREILMMASKQIKTPSMEIPFLKDLENLNETAHELRRKLTRAVVGDVLEKVDVTSELVMHPVRQHRYVLKFCFLPYKYYKDDFYVKPKMILKHMSKKFFGEMFTVVRRYAKKTSPLIVMGDEKTKRTRKTNEDGDDEDNGDNNENNKNGDKNDEFINDNDSSEEEPEDNEDAKATNKFKQVHDDQEPEEDEETVLNDPMSEFTNDNGDDNQNGGNGDDDDDDDNVDDAERKKVVGNYNFAENYTYDKKKYSWCELTFALPISMKKLDMTAILKEVAAKSVIWETPNIKRAITYMSNDRLMLRTDGINMLEMFKYYDILDLNKLYSNDIHQMAGTYGIEAAMKVIVKEIQDVFNVYGIKVDPRHLLLIADYMTYSGEFKPLSRKGMENCASPLQQMSFESSLTFMKQATVNGKRDNLRNPSSCIIVGKPCTNGTGSFDLLEKIPLTNTTNIA